MNLIECNDCKFRYSAKNGDKCYNLDIIDTAINPIENECPCHNCIVYPTCVYHHSCDLNNTYFYAILNIVRKQVSDAEENYLLMPKLKKKWFKFEAFLKKYRIF